MASSLDHSLSLAQLEQALAAADPSALLVTPRILRRVIKQHREVTGIGLRVPHRKSYVIDAETLLKFVERDELGLSAGVELPATVILLARPDPERLAAQTAGESLTKYWKLLFHARVHVELERRIEEGGFDEAALRDRLARIGPAEFAEIRAVLRQEDLLLPPASSRAAYVEFVAVYLELRSFTGFLLPSYFPSLAHDFGRIDDILAADVNAAELLAATRLPGAPEPEPPADRLGSELFDETGTAEVSVAPARPSEWVYRRLNARAHRAAARGNSVRAAILRARAARYVRPSLAARARAAARDELNRLVDRLQAALEFSEHDAPRWSRALAALLNRSVQGFWTRESRTLYDLQKVCVDFERDVYTLDLVEWALSWGKLPIKRHLPGQREVLMSKHLRTAARRASKARIADADRQRLVELLDAAVRRAEASLRAYFRPLITAALEQVGLAPANLPERVARKKLVEELLDQIAQRDFLAMSNLRDAISRNNLKLPDLGGAEEFLLGDQLLRADRKLATSLDGVYHRGEVYLRWPQRFSSLAFGTHPGRLLVRFVALPYGGAYLVLAGISHLIGMVIHAVTGGREEPILDNTTLTFLTVVAGTFLLGLMHVPAFRRASREALRMLWRAVRWVLVDVPDWLLRLPLVRRILQSPLYRVVARYIVKPLVFTVLILAAFRRTSSDVRATSQNGLMVFFLVNLLVNSRLGRNVEEVLTDAAVRGWDRFRIRVLAALVQVTMEFFNRVVDTLDRFLYSVDEWLRFRTGQNPAAILAKSALGVVWFFIRYVVRFCINLLIEPQINPVKHVPVVTVSHKILISVSVPMYEQIRGPLESFFGRELAATLFGTTIFVIPGAIGFLVWELKENWRLYQANRPRQLQPVGVGRHGETIVRLLRPGFHSGTLPKLYARLRRALRKAPWTENWKRPRKVREAIQRAERDVRHFVERDLLAVLAQSHRFRPLAVELRRVEPAAGGIRIELACDALSDKALWISLDEQAGWLIARLRQPGWTTRLPEIPRQALADALTGWYKMAGVELVDEQVRSVLEPYASTYELTEEGLLVRPEGGRPAEALYDLRQEPLIEPQTSTELFVQPPQFSAEELVFASAPVTWELWVDVWTGDESGGRYPPQLIVGAHLLPRSRQRVAS